VSWRVVAPNRWSGPTWAAWHAAAANVAIELVDPEEANRLRAEIAAAREAGDQIGDLVGGEDD